MKVKAALSMYSAPLVAAAGMSVASPAYAFQSEPAPPPVTQTDFGDDNVPRDEIVVTAPDGQIPVLSGIQADKIFGAAAIASFGASDLADLINQLAPQLQSVGLRNSGQTIVLINGRRVSGFGEVSNLPPEAILQLEIFPAEVALTYGYAADQRVVNVVLKSRYATNTVKIESGAPVQGGNSAQEVEGNLFRIARNSRVNISAEYNRVSALTEAERKIVQSAGVVDDGQYRSLIPASTGLNIGGTVSGPINNQTNASLNLRFAAAQIDGQLGPDLSERGRQLRYTNISRVIHAGASSDGHLGDWRWTLNGNFDRAVSSRRNERNNPNPALTLGVDTSNTATNSGDVNVQLTGTIIELPGGPFRTTFQATGDFVNFAGMSVRDASETSINLSRRRIAGSITVELPVTDPQKQNFNAGRLTIIGRAANRYFNDLGHLPNWTIGINWEHSKILSLSATWIWQKEAPSLLQLGAPLLITRDRTIYDFTRGATVLADITSGGNPDLLPELRRDFRLQANFRPITNSEFSINANYARIRARNTTAEFPPPTPEVEMAFPGRFVRNAIGNIMSIDQRPVNFKASASKALRYGGSYSKDFGRKEARGQGNGNRGKSARRSTEPGQRGRWDIAAYHTVSFQDQVQLGSGGPVLDLLNGSATYASGGSAKNEIEVDGGWFDGGIGIRLHGLWRQGSKVLGGLGANGATGTDLVFSDRMRVNLSTFVVLDDSEALVSKIPFLRHMRLQLSVSNILNDRQSVRDETGAVPLGYQAGLVDPQGRYVEVRLQTRF